MSAFILPSMEGEFGTLGGPEKWVVEVPLQPLVWVGLAAIYCRHLLTRQRISLALVQLVIGGVPMSLHRSLPCPAIPARGQWGCRGRSGYLRKAGTLGNRYKIGHLGKGGTCLSMNTTIGEG